MEDVFQTIENPGQGLGPLEVTAIQEAGPRNIRPKLEEVADGEVNADTTFDNIVIYSFTRNNVPYNVYWTNGGSETTLPTAIVLREPPEDVDVSPIFLDNPQGPRPILGVDTPEGRYFSIHAKSGSGLNTGNDAGAVLNNIFGRFDDKPTYILGDFNRDIATNGNPSGNIAAAFPNNGGLKPPNATTFNARVENPESTLDYLFTGQPLVNEQGTVLNQGPRAKTPDFPSIIFPLSMMMKLRKI